MGQYIEPLLTLFSGSNSKLIKRDVTEEEVLRVVNSLPDIYEILSSDIYSSFLD